MYNGRGSRRHGMGNSYDDFFSDPMQEAASKSAVALRAQFLALQAVGFSDDQAMEIIKAMLTAANRKSE